MDVTPEELAIPYLRSCHKETPSPIPGTVTGSIPVWLQGTLIRIGPGLLDIGPDRYVHIFDGLALLHQFSINNGQITYQNRFLRSDTYKKNTRANRIVVSEFATTAAAPDPCKTIFQRFGSLFSPDFTDNVLVNVVKYTDEYYACSEVNYIWKVDPETLESQKKIDLRDYAPIRTGTAHPHEDKDGTVYGVGISAGRNLGHSIVKFLPKVDDRAGAFDRGQIVANIPASRRFAVSYCHSFGMTENYFVVIEQPLVMSVPSLIFQQFTSYSYADYLQWQPEWKTRFHVIRREDGKLLSTQYIAKSFLVFHHINTYEDDDHLVVDVCCYDDGKILKAMYRKALEEFSRNSSQFPETANSSARRYILPLKINNETKQNLVQLPKSTAEAFLENDGSVYCKPEMLTEEGYYPELPRIHYEKYNTQKYRYFYSMAKFQTFDRTYVIKVDTENKTTSSWDEMNGVPSEPVFVADPNSTGDEDDGVLMFSLLFTDDDRKVAVVLLDAKTMKEIGRAVFKTDSSVPGDLHGIFIPKSSTKYN